MLKIYGHEGAPNVRKVLWGAAELQIEFEVVPIGGNHGPLDTPEYRSVNPNAKMPSIDDDGFVLWESHAILRYLARKVGDAALYPPDLQSRSIVEQWLDWQAAHQAHAVRTLARLFMAPDSPSAIQVGDAAAAAEPLFDILEQRLTQSAFVAGDGFTLADIPAAIGFERWSTLPIDHQPTPATTAWFSQISRRPAFRSAPARPR